MSIDKLIILNKIPYFYGFSQQRLLVLEMLLGIVLFLILFLIYKTITSGPVSTINESDMSNRRRTLQLFKKTFLYYKHKYLVFRPNFSLPNMDPEYAYFDLNGYDEWGFSKNDMKRRTGQIKGLCKECQINPATVGYYETGYMEYTDTKNYWNLPTDGLQVLCKECAFKKIEPALSSYAKPFSKGLSSSYIGDGIYIALKRKE